jgi:Uma2 family endonuclease
LPELRRVFHAEQFMSMPALHQRQWTVDEVERLADGQVEPTNRYELADGELLVTASPTDRHQTSLLPSARRARVLGRRWRVQAVEVWRPDDARAVLWTIAYPGVQS